MLLKWQWYQERLAYFCKYFFFFYQINKIIDDDIFELRIKMMKYPFVVFNYAFIELFRSNLDNLF